MNANKLFDKIITKIDDNFQLYKIIDVSPKGSLVKKKINNNTYYYLQYRLFDKIKSDYIEKDNVENLKEIIRMRKKLEKTFKNNVVEITKLIKILKIYDIELYRVAMEEFRSFKLDTMPSYKKINVKFSSFITKLDANSKIKEDEINNLITKWSNNQIRIRDIEKYLISKFIS